MKLNDDGTAEFNIGEVGEDSSQTFMGTFKVKCILSPLEFIDADRLRRELLGSFSEISSEHVRNITVALSQLQYRVVMCPEFWKNPRINGGHVDENVINVIFEKAVEAQELFKAQKLKAMIDMQTKLTAKIKNQEIKKTEETSETDDDLKKLDKELDETENSQLNETVTKTFDMPEDEN
jgi:hypothetical protein